MFDLNQYFQNRVCVGPDNKVLKLGEREFVPAKRKARADHIRRRPRSMSERGATIRTFK